MQGFRFSVVSFATADIYQMVLFSGIVHRLVIKYSGGPEEYLKPWVSNTRLATTFVNYVYIIKPTQKLRRLCITLRPYLKVYVMW
jgi:hypothetical protein